jgi:transaldolase
MKFFLDSADIEEIIEINNLAILDGVTTNPSSIAKITNELKATIAHICKIVTGDVSIEIIANDYDNMLKEGHRILEIGENIVLKLPIIWDGIKACKYFANRDVKVNMTLCFTANQALLAAKAGAYYISPFVGRLDDVNQDGMQLIKDIKQIYRNYNYSTKILAASIRNVNHVFQSALCGADVVTMSSKIIKQLLHHPLTIEGLDNFNKDWIKSGFKIID